MERKEVLEAYGLRDTKMSPDRKADSEVTEAEEEILSHSFSANLDGSRQLLASLCGRELTIRHSGVEQMFNLPFWATFESLNHEGVLVGFRLEIDDYQCLEFYCSDKFVIQQWKTALQNLIVLQGFYEDFKPTVKIGKGKSASVFLAKRRADQEKVAIKAFLKSELEKDRKDMLALENEVNILRNV